MEQTSYSMSFTTAPLLYPETMTVARLYGSLMDWTAVRNKVLSDNLLHMRTINSSKRILSELTSRLKQLTPAQLEMLLQSVRREQNYLLWLAFCKRYRFVHHFAVEVIHEKFLRLDLELNYEAYDIFFHDKAEWHPEVENVAEATRKKQRQFLYRIMREVELLTEQNQIIPAILSPQLIDVIRDDDPAYLAIYPVR